MVTLPNRNSQSSERQGQGRSYLLTVLLGASLFQASFVAESFWERQRLQAETFLLSPNPRKELAHIPVSFWSDFCYMSHCYNYRATRSSTSER